MRMSCCHCCIVSNNLRVYFVRDNDDGINHYYKIAFGGIVVMGKEINNLYLKILTRSGL